MMKPDERALDALLRAVGAELERMDDDLAFQDEAHLCWLAEDLRAGLTRAERACDEREATRFAERIAARGVIERAERRLPRRELRYRSAPFVATVSQAIGFAKAARCAPLLGLSAAAGGGRDLWDEPSETWVELPGDVSPGAHIAMGVSGDSMVPVLTLRDVIVVKLGTTPAVDDLVVAQVPEGGFVVKRVASITPESIELASFNAAYDPFVLQRHESTVLGTVIARFSRG